MSDNSGPQRVVKPEVGTLVPRPDGNGALQYGSRPGQNKGGGGPTNLFKKRLKELLKTKRLLKSGGRSKRTDDFAFFAFLKECLDGKHGQDAFFRAYDRIVDRTQGKVPTVSEVRGSDEPLIIHVVTGPR